MNDKVKAVIQTILDRFESGDIPEACQSACKIDPGSGVIGIQN